MTNNDLPQASNGELLITIRSFHAQHEGSEILVRLTIENGEHRESKSLLLTMEQYCDLKLKKGPINEETYDRLEEASTFCHALRHGEYLLSFGGNSAQMLSRKLTQRGYSREISDAVAKQLTDVGLIDEEQDMRREVEKCLRKLWGAKRISAHLWSRGFATETLAGLSNLLSEVDFCEHCASLIRKKYGTVPTDPDERRRMTASLSRYGYSLGEIREGSRRVGE